MNVDVKGVHMDITQGMRDYLDKKLKRLSYAEDHIVDLLFSLTQDSKAYKVEVNINFKSEADFKHLIDSKAGTCNDGNSTEYHHVLSRENSGKELVLMKSTWER